MRQKALITSASNKFFPSLVNLLGSIKANYPGHPQIFIYDLGLYWIFRKELDSLQGVTVLDMPRFVSFWRSCYTWKTYILSHPLADLNFYLDAGTQVLKPLDDIFVEIEKENYFAIQQGVSLKQIVPEDYWDKLGLNRINENEESIHAGELGFKADSEISEVLYESYNWALKGLALGFSPKDKWRDKGYNKIGIVRNCEIFRHDMTLLNIAFRKKFGKAGHLNSGVIFAGGYKSHPNQAIWNLRLSFRKLDYCNQSFLHPRFSFIAWLNRIIIGAMLVLKNGNLYFKKHLGLLTQGE